MDFFPFFYPGSVAIIGSMGAGKLGAILAGQIQAGGYRGSLYAVNPKAEGAAGISAYTSAAAIPTPPDLAVIVSPAATVAGVLDDCGQAGIRAAVIITSGFSETGSTAGEAEILAAARRNRIRFIGPNCAGIISAHHAFYPTLEMRPDAGQVALVSQSGALGGVVLGWALQKRLGISKFISYGNGADLNQVDFLRYLAEDEETRVVAVYIESVRSGRDFMAALAACAARKPVLVIKAGRTSAGTRATASHTGSLAGSDAVYDAAIRASGAIRVASVDALLDLCETFISTPLPAGRRLAIVTNSGGPGVLAADRAEELGLSVPEPTPEQQTALRTFLPAHASLKNPIDLTVEGTEAGFRETLRALLPGYDAALAINVGTAYLDNLALARGVADGNSGSGKPVMACFVPAQLMDASAAHLKNSSVPVFPSGERAVEALSALARYPALRGQAARFAPPPALDPLPLPASLLEPEAMAWLGENGLPIPRFRLAADHDQAVEACRALGYPVVMKVVSPDILHKSDVGGVITGVSGDDAARAAFQRIQAAARGCDFRGAVVYPQISGAQEVLMGLSTDPQFGPVVAFGLGGIYTEIFRDVVLRIAPVDALAALEMIHSVRAVKLLTGARGRPPCDLDALARTLAAFSLLPFRYPEIAEIDLNPVFALPTGLVIGDVRVIRKP